MKIVWNENPLRTTVHLDAQDEMLLTWRVRVEELTNRMSAAHFELDLESRKFFASIGKATTDEEAIARARRRLECEFVAGDATRDGKTWDEFVAEQVEEYASALLTKHEGDCTCVPCSCLKCHAESLVGVDTCKGLGKHEASMIEAVFLREGEPERSLDEVLTRLEDYEPKDVPDWGIPHVPRWREEGRRAYAWLLAYKEEHFAGKANRGSSR